LLGVRRREERKFTGQALFEKKTGNFASVIHFGQCKARQSQTCGRHRGSDPLFYLTPPCEELLPHSLIAASGSNLGCHELSIIFDRADNLSQ
jgi:hypothetical protein